LSRGSGVKGKKWVPRPAMRMRRMGDKVGEHAVKPHDDEQNGKQAKEAGESVHHE